MPTEPDDPRAATPLPPDPATPPPPPREVPLAQRSSPVNTALVIGSVLLTLWTDFGAEPDRVAPWLISLWPAHSPAWLLEVRHGQVWRLFTPVFLHFSWVHLGMNLLGTFSLTRLLERCLGSRAFLAGAAGLALGSNAAQYFLWGEPGFGGLSGVLYGFFGYVWLRAYADREFPLEISRDSLFVALAWYALCFTGKLGDIANTAHTAGLLLGAAWGWWDGRLATRRLPPPVSAPST